jgi:hypothetical protein
LRREWRQQHGQQRDRHEPGVILGGHDPQHLIDLLRDVVHLVLEWRHGCHDDLIVEHLVVEHLVVEHLVVEHVLFRVVVFELVDLGFLWKHDGWVV